MAENKDRFVKTYKEGAFGHGFEIWVDQETGVNYVWRQSGLTVLLDREGKPVISPIEK